MAVSLEALAMAGVNCDDCNIGSIEECERISMLQIPPYLLAKKKKRKFERRVRDVPGDIGCDGCDGDHLGSSNGEEKKIKKRSMKSMAMWIIKIIVTKLSLMFRMPMRKRWCI
ncbi:hypothetical protein CsSME_00014303 [Camellia sinensis var. sinensis]